MARKKGDAAGEGNARRAVENRSQSRNRKSGKTGPKAGSDSGTRGSPVAEGKGRKQKGESANRVAKEARRKARKEFNAYYESELARQQIELVKLQEWIKHEGLKIVAIFEGRDAAGKGGVIKRITQSLNPRGVPGGGPRHPHRAREDPVVLPALRRQPARGGRDGALRSELVQTAPEWSG